MKSKVLWLAVMVAATTACWNPFSPADDDQFAWTVDGQSFEATDDGSGALRGGGNVFLTGIDCDGGSGVSMTVIGDVAVGTVPVGSGLFATYTPDGRTGEAAGANYEAGPGRGSGSLTITSASSDRVSGTFSLQLVAGPGNPGGGVKAVQGDFDLEFDDDTIC